VTVRHPSARAGRRGSSEHVPPGGEPLPGGLTGVPWRRLLGYARPHALLFAVAFAGLGLRLVAGLLMPLVIGGVVNEVASASDPSQLRTMLVVLLFLALLLAVAGFVQGLSLGIIGERIVARLRGRLFDGLVALELDFYVRRRVGELISRLTSDVTQVRALLTSTVTELVSEIFLVAGSIVILLILNPTLLLVVLILAPLLLGVALVMGRPLRRLSTRVQDSIARSTTTAEEALSGIRVVKAFGREAWEQGRYAANVGGIVGTAIRLVSWRSLFGSIMTFLGFGALIVILGYTGGQVIEGTLSLGALTAFLLYGVAIGSGLGTIATRFGQFQEGAGAVARVFELMDERSAITDAPDALALSRVEGAITFEGVTFGYQDDRDVLRDIDLDIRPGEVLGLVGPSGSGKTTLCNLVPRLWDVRSGRLLIDGHDVRGLTLRSLRQAIALVPQEATVFGGTIRENILYGRLEASEDDLLWASRAANLHDFVSELADGYQTVIGDRGMRLSGGQRQRLAIARAILKDAPILILDEATSSLDNESERLVQEALGRLMDGRTTIVVAHRLSTIRHAHRIAVLDDGWLLELGTHEELLAMDGLYAHLWRLQASERPSAPAPEPFSPVYHDGYDDHHDYISSPVGMPPS
jgi:subfamily B ATP-binding cassette protein MsbA